MNGAVSARTRSVLGVLLGQGAVDVLGHSSALAGGRAHNHSSVSTPPAQLETDAPAMPRNSLQETIRSGL